MVNNFARITGGADLHCLQLTEALRTRGHEVAMVATSDPANTEALGEFVPLAISNATRDGYRGWRALSVAGRALWNPYAARATKVTIEQFRPDVVHLHKLYVQLSVAPVVVAARNGLPVVQTVHDYEFTAAAATDARGGWRDRVEPRFDYRALNTVLYGIKRHVHQPRVAAWIAVSRATAAVYASHGIHAKVLPNFTLTDGVEVPAPQFHDRTAVLYLGRLVESKGVLDVLQLAAQAPNIPIVIAGQGPLSDRVREAADAHPNITYAGTLGTSEVGTALRAARLLVMPSLWHEPGPLVALEAMAHGTPIVAYNNGGLAEYVEDAGAGVVIQPDARSLVRAAKALYHDRESWSVLAKRGPAAVRATHSIESYVDGLESIYEHVVRRCDVLGGRSSETLM